MDIAFFKTEAMGVWGMFDPVSSLSHFLGAIVFAVLSRSLLRRAKSRAHWIALAVFATSAVMLLTFSGLYHFCPKESFVRAIMLRVDMAAIFLLIAGSYTPAHIILFRGFRRWGVLTMVWMLACVGIVVNTLFLEQGGKALALTMFLTLGWLGVYSTVEIGKKYGWELVETLVLGGVSYSLGGFLDFVGSPTIIPGIFGAHEMLHALVLVGLGCHWNFALRIARGYEPVAKPAVARAPLAVQNAE